MKYIVSLGIHKFEFEDGTTALSFAELAVKNFQPTEYSTAMKPLISIVEDGEGEEEC